MYEYPKEPSKNLGWRISKWLGDALNEGKDVLSHNQLMLQITDNPAKVIESVINIKDVSFMAHNGPPSKKCIDEIYSSIMPNSGVVVCTQGGAGHYFVMARDDYDTNAPELDPNSCYILDFHGLSHVGMPDLNSGGGQGFYRGNLEISLYLGNTMCDSKWLEVACVTTNESQLIDQMPFEFQGKQLVGFSGPRPRRELELGLDSLPNLSGIITGSIKRSRRLTRKKPKPKKKKSPPKKKRVPETKPPPRRRRIPSPRRRRSRSRPRPRPRPRRRSRSRSRSID